MKTRLLPHYLTIQLLLIVGFFTVSPIIAQDSAIKIVKSKALSMVPGRLFDLPYIQNTGAVSTVSGDYLYKMPSSNTLNTLYGLLPGLTVLQGGSGPNGTSVNMVIRGVGSYNYGNMAVFVDGFQVPLSYISSMLPEEIESISILKDAASLATLGMKGANGALWIVTKKGNKGKPKMSLQMRTGWQQPMLINKPLNAWQYAQYYNEAASNDNGRQWTPVYTNISNITTNTDWYANVLKNQSSLSSADLNIQGGNEDARYSVVLGYVGDRGLYNVQNDDTHSNTTLQQFNIRTNLDFNAFNIFEGRISIGGSTDDRRMPNYTDGSLWNNLASYPNIIYPAINTDGSYPGTNVYPNNPLASIRELGYLSYHDRSMLGNMLLKEKLDMLVRGLYLYQGVSFSTWTRGTYSVTKDYARMLNGIIQTTDQNTNYTVYDDYGTNQWNWSQFSVGAGYEKHFGEHSLHADVNYWQYKYNVDANQNGNAGLNTAYGFNNINGKIHYDYRQKYSAELGWAISGSDNFRKGNQYGFYPAVSFAWNISQEGFLKSVKNIDLLRLRASVGKLGYDNFDNGRYLYQLYYKTIGSYAMGNDAPTWQNGYGMAYIPNADIFAEQSLKYNIGIDSRFFQQIDFTVDAFLDKRSGIITQNNSLMSTIGTTPPYQNIGKVTSKGFETSLRWSGKSKKLNYTIGGWVAYSINTIDYMAEVPPVTTTAALTGKSIGSYFGYIANGFYDISDFNANGTLKSGLPQPTFGSVQPGDIKYKDINGDNVIDEKDVTKIGNSYYPKWNYSADFSVEYKGFDLRVLLQGVAGRSVNLLDASNQIIAFNNNGNIYNVAQKRWAYYPAQNIDTRATATYPRLSLQNNLNNYRNSTQWIVNGDFARIRSIELGYTFSSAVIKKALLSGFRVYVNVMNPFTWSHLKKEYDLDPEIMNGYPVLKCYNFGLRASF